MIHFVNHPEALHKKSITAKQCVSMNALNLNATGTPRDIKYESEAFTGSLPANKVINT